MSSLRNKELESLNTNFSIAELCRKHNVTPNPFYGWKEKFLEAGKLGLTGSLKTGPSEELVRENESLKKLIGELTIANSAFKSVDGRRREKMNALEIMQEDGLSLRKALGYFGSSRCMYYYEPRRRTVNPDPVILQKLECIAQERPSL